MTDFLNYAVSFVILFSVAIAYLAPSYIAMKRGHHQFYSILVVNTVLGWTLLGWVVSLAWSVSYLPYRRRAVDIDTAVRA